MSDARAHFRELLEAGDVDGLRAAWASVAPHLPQPQSREAAEIVMHRARTEADSLPLKARAWSHRWLTERGYPTGLPDRLKPAAERLYPRIVEAVGISVRATSDMTRAAAPLVERAMSDAVADLYASNPSPDPALVRLRMAEARRREIRRLFG